MIGTMAQQGTRTYAEHKAKGENFEEWRRMPRRAIPAPPDEFWELIERPSGSPQDGRSWQRPGPGGREGQARTRQARQRMGTSPDGGRRGQARSGSGRGGQVNIGGSGRQ